MDWEALRVWAVLEGAKAPNRGLAKMTVNRRIRRLQRLHNLGYDLEGDLVNEGRRALAAAASGEHSPNTHRNWVKALNTLARYQGKGNPFEYREAPPPPEHRALSPAEVNRLTQVTWDDDYRNYLGRAAVHLSLYLGIRRTEFAALEKPHLDPPGPDDPFGVVRVRHPVKGGRRRRLPVESIVWSSKRPFGAYLRNKLTDPEDPQALWVRPASYVDDRDTPIRCTGTFLYNLIREAGQRAGIDYNFNISRHTAMTNLYRETAAKKKHVQAQAGWASSDQADTYVNVPYHDLREILEDTPRRDPYGNNNTPD